MKKTCHASVWFFIGSIILGLLFMFKHTNENLLALLVLAHLIITWVLIYLDIDNRAQYYANNKIRIRDKRTDNPII